MFQVGEYVVYGLEGVCRIEEIGCPDMGGLDKTREYYRLSSYYRGGTIYAPTDGKIAMRRPASEEEARIVLSSAATVEELQDVPQDGRKAGEYYKAILQEHDLSRLMQLCKTLQKKQEKLLKLRRGVNATELRSWKIAEDMLLGELAFSLKRDLAELRETLRERYLL